MRENSMRYVLLVIWVSLSLIFGCKPKDEHQGYSQKDNFYYKLLSIGDGKIKPDTSDYLWIDASCRNLKDSIFWDTKHNAFQSFFVKQNSFSFTKHLFTLSEGDSVQYLVPSALFFKEVFKLGLPFFSEKDSAVKCSIKILQIVSPDEYAHINDSLHAGAEELLNEEYGQIENYMTNLQGPNIEFSKDAFLQITHPAQGDSIKWGRKVSILYKGYFLDGRLADPSPNNKPFEFTIGQEGQVLEGLKLALYHLKKGEKAKIILPSRLAFGSRGSSNGSIAPYTPLLYEVEVLDVKK